jgi:hypothetical protein
MNFEVSEKTRELLQRLQAFMDSHVYPNEEEFQAEIAQVRWKPTRIVGELKAKARHGSCCRKNCVSQRVGHTDGAPVTETIYLA